MQAQVHKMCNKMCENSYPKNYNPVLLFLVLLIYQMVNSGLTTYNFYPTVWNFAGIQSELPPLFMIHWTSWGYMLRAQTDLFIFSSVKHILLSKS